MGRWLLGEETAREGWLAGWLGGGEVDKKMGGCCWPGWKGLSGMLGDVQEGDRQAGTRPLHPSWPELLPISQAPQTPQPVRASRMPTAGTWTRSRSRSR